MTKDVNFDRLVKLYDESPELYEIERRMAIREFLFSIENKQQRIKLEQLQWMIEGELRKQKTPLTKYNKLTELFWKTVSKLQR